MKNLIFKGFMGIILLVILTSFNCKAPIMDKDYQERARDYQQKQETLNKLKVKKALEIQRLRAKNFKKYIEAKYPLYYKLGNRESRMSFTIASQHIYKNRKTHKIDTLQTIGCWQFTIPTLRGLGYSFTYEEFKANPSIFSPEEQLRAVLKLSKLHLSIIKRRCKDILSNTNTILGMPITDEALTFASHLSGAGGVIAFLNSGGTHNPKDKNNTSLINYFNLGNNART